jgi:hypothetical protein
MLRVFILLSITCLFHLRYNKDEFIFFRGLHTADAAPVGVVVIKEAVDLPIQIHTFFIVGEYGCTSM